MTIHVVNLDTAKVPVGTTCINIADKTSPLRNPFKLPKDDEKSRLLCLSVYKHWFYKQIAARNSTLLTELDRVQNIAKYTLVYLGCYCKPALCHGDLIKNYLDNVAALSITSKHNKPV